MPTYTYRCGDCLDETSETHPIGTARRVKKCGCGRPARLVIGDGVQVNLRSNVTVLDDRRFDKDGPAYQRMRARGLQPERIDGAARLEDTVHDQDDIDYARAIKVAEKVGGGKERVVETVRTLEVTHGT